MAPEVLRCPRQGESDYTKDRQLYDHKVDCWAIGILAYELVVGRAPFSDREESKAVRNILEAPLALPEGLSEDGARFIRAALSRDPRHRLSIAEMLRHNWICSHLPSNVTIGARPHVPVRNRRGVPMLALFFFHTRAISRHLV